MFEVRACADQDEYGRAVGAIGQYFNPPPSEELLELFARTLPHERMHAAFEDGQIVGGAGVFPFELSVPGGSLPCGGVTAVGVQPTHRRRGVLRSMMDVQLRDVHERGEPIAALWASEETIYGRFGYGISAWAGEFKIPHEWDAFAEPLEPAGTARFVTAEEARELFPPVYEAVRRQRLPAEADALAEDHGADQTRDTGVDVHDRTAGEVQRTPFEQPPARRENPVRDRAVHEYGPDNDERHERCEPPAIRRRTGNQRRRDNREHHLEYRESQRRNCRRAVSGQDFIHMLHAGEMEPAHEPVTGAEGQRE
jgi:GNAT superfamily N-acetyltransferase